MNQLKNKKILITGGSGFIPSHLTRSFVHMGAEVAILTKYNSLIDNVRLADIWKQIKVIEADIRNQDSLKLIAEFKPEIVYHFAAYNHVGDSFIHVREALDCNLIGSANLLEAWDAYERFIYISTSESYGYQASAPFNEDMEPNPISPYAVGKYAGELYSRMKMSQMKRPIIVLRPFNAFGPYQSPRAVIAEMIIKCLTGQVITATEGTQTRDFNYIENLVDGFIAAATSPNALGQIINIGSGEEISIRELIYLIHQETQSSSEIKMGKLPFRPTEIWRMFASNTKAKEILGWSPRVTFLEGLRRTIAWYKRYLEVYQGPSSFYNLCKIS